MISLIFSIFEKEEVIMENYAFYETYHNEWSVANWGTKWNAYGYDKYTDYSGCKELTFKTAWSAPHPILKNFRSYFRIYRLSTNGRMRI